MLEFHIVADPTNGLTYPERERMVRQLHDKGPRIQAGDSSGVVPGRPARTSSTATETFNDKQYALCWITPERSMVNGPGIRPWSMESALGRKSDEHRRPDGQRSSSTPSGGSLFHDFTANVNLGRSLAAILDRKIVSAANINRRSSAGTGRSPAAANGFSDDELTYLVDTLNAGSLPAQLEPTSRSASRPSARSWGRTTSRRACTPAGSAW